MVTAIGSVSPRCAARRPRTARWWLGAIPAIARDPPSGLSRAIERLAAPSCGSRATIAPAVTYGPVSCSKNHGIGSVAQVGGVDAELLAGRVRDLAGRERVRQRVQHPRLDLVDRHAQADRDPRAAAQDPAHDGQPRGVDVLEQQRRAVVGRGEQRRELVAQRYRLGDSP